MSAAERNRIYRARRKAGLRAYTVTIDEVATETLLRDIGLIDGFAGDDPKLVAAALEAFLQFVLDAA
jgi:hypothetical protein